MNLLAKAASWTMQFNPFGAPLSGLVFFTAVHDSCAGALEPCGHQRFCSYRPGRVAGPRGLRASCQLAFDNAVARVSGTHCGVRRCARAWCCGSTRRSIVTLRADGDRHRVESMCGTPREPSYLMSHARPDPYRSGPRVQRKRSRDGPRARCSDC